MTILVLIQHAANEIPKSSLSAVTAAVALKKNLSAEKIIGIVIADESIAKKAAVEGLDSVLYVSDSKYNPYFFAAYTDLLLEVLEKFSATTFVTTSTSLGKDLAPRIAAALDAGQASDIISVNQDGTVTRPMYAGDILADVSVETPKKVFTVRSSAFSPDLNPAEIKIEQFISSVGNSDSLGKVEKIDVVKAERPQLGDAKIVVSGGRALQSSENFEKYIYPLADSLGAAVGASRAAVDSGYAPNDWQVGQTGKIVAPELYIAVGISGAIQHLAGMKDSKKIVAINKDAEAPIFEIADYGLLGDIFQVLPELTEAIKAIKK